MLIANHSFSGASNWNWKPPIFSIPISLAWALTICFFLGHCSWPASLCLLLIPQPYSSLHIADSSRQTPPLKTSLSTCHILPLLNLLKILQWLPISCQTESKFLPNLARVKQFHESILLYPSLPLLFPTCPSAVVGRVFLLPLYTAISFLLCTSVLCLKILHGP